MPNWCATTITFNGNKENVERFYDLIEKWTSKNAMDNSFGERWLGNVLINSGIVKAEDIDNKPHPRCRGWIEHYDEYVKDDFAQLVIHTETAWSPMMEMWDLINEKYEFEFEIIYQAEECGMEIYYTNDPCIIGKYVFDVYGDGIPFESDWEMDKDNLINRLQILLNTTKTDIEVLLDMYEDSYVSENVAIHEWELVEIEELY